MKILKILTLVLTVASSAALLSACGNTLHGAGQDIENAGEKIQDL